MTTEAASTAVPEQELAQEPTVAKRELDPILLLTLDDAGAITGVAEKQPPTDLRSSYEIDKWIRSNTQGGRFMPVKVIFKRAYAPKKVQPVLAGCDI